MLTLTACPGDDASATDTGFTDGNTGTDDDVGSSSDESASESGT